MTERGERAFLLRLCGGAILTYIAIIIDNVTLWGIGAFLVVLNISVYEWAVRNGPKT